jgi:two-component system sensor histidine kinase EvgS
VVFPKKWICAIILILLLLSPQSFALDDTVIKQHYVFGGDHDYPPYEFIDENGNPAGFNIDLLGAIAEVMGMDIEIRLGPWNEVRTALERGELDGLTGMYYSEQRDKLVDFSTGFLIVHTTVFVRKDYNGITSEEDLAGKEIIVPYGDIMHDYLLEKKITDKIITVESPAQALRLLASGKHDCALLGNLQGFYLAKKLKLDNIKAIKSVLFTQEYCFATKEGNDQLLSSLNEGLAIIKETGKYKEIYENWFGTLSAQHLIIKNLTKYGSIILLILTVGFLLALSWSRVLKIRVEEKTKELRKELLERMITEEKLRVSEERYRKLFESMLDGFILLKPVADKDGNINNFKIIEANTSFLKAVGKKKEEVVGKMLWDIFPTVYKSHIKVYEKVIETGRATHFEIHSDETNKTFEIVGFTPQTGYFAAIVRDITQRKQAEKALKDNLEKSGNYMK